MQMIKGLIALVAVAILVFVTVIIYNKKTEPAYIARMHRQTASLTQSSMPARHIAHTKSVVAGHKNAKL